ncbi:MAG: YvbH-like oligomerization domain-containing protein [Prochlorothrix sp.]
MNQYVFDWLESSHKTYTRHNFGEVFAHYIGEGTYHPA